MRHLRAAARGCRLAAALLMFCLLCGGLVLAGARDASAQLLEGLQRGITFGGNGFGPRDRVGRPGLQRGVRGNGDGRGYRSGRPRFEGGRASRFDRPRSERRRPAVRVDQRGPRGPRMTRPSQDDRRLRPDRRPRPDTTVTKRRPPRPGKDQASTTPQRPDGRPKPCYGRRCPDGRPTGVYPTRPPRRPPIIVSIPPFFPPVPPPVVHFDPPQPPPPRAGGTPPRATPPGRRPPQRVARAFGGPPPTGESRYVPDEIICVLRDDLTDDDVDQFLADNRLAPTDGGSIRIGLIGVRVFRYRITDGRSVQQAIADVQGDPRGVSVQPNYIYGLSEMPLRQVPRGYRVAQQAGPIVRPTARTSAGGTTQSSVLPAPQYVVTKLRLAQAHRLSRGERVLIAVIDSGVDLDHPELAAGVVQQIDVTDDKDGTPHSHGTAMTGAIVSQSQLTGVAPGARVIAIRAFSPRSRSGASGTSFHIARAIDLAAKEGVRIINLSIAGPNDPYVRKAIEEARARGIILVAAAGNAGPSSPPLYPAAYPEVIAVTATDAYDRLYEDANRGDHIEVAAPGVDVLVPAPRGAYGMTTGTSVAAAHVSGVLALMISRNPQLDPDAAREVLHRSVRAVADGGRREQFGTGHADAHQAVMASGPTEPQPAVAAGQGRATPVRQPRRQ